MAGASLEHRVINMRDSARVAEMVLQNVYQKMAISKEKHQPTKTKDTVKMEERKEERKEARKEERKGELKNLSKKFRQKRL